MGFSFKIKKAGRWVWLRSDDRLLLIGVASIVGICSGLAALALHHAIALAFDSLNTLRHYWWAVGLPALGAALSAIFLDRIVKEGAGHGVPEVVYAVSRHGGLLRFRSSFSRLISSCLTIGSGGSAGPEAPVVMSGAAIGSNIASQLSLNDRQRSTLVGCGAAGAIAAIFNAPIAGMVFTVEVILGEWRASNIIPIAVAAVAGAKTCHLLRGDQILFAHQTFSISLSDIGASIGLAVVCALVSVFLTRALRSMHAVSAKVKAPLWVRAAIGGLSVGLIGAFFPLVLGEGYHAIQEMIQGHFVTGVWVVAAACLLKILASALTLGWGGSGGIFAPCLLIGSLVGLTYHRLLVLVGPGLEWVNEGCFALLGMAGLISGIMQAPLTGIFLIVELTGGYEVILPLIVVSAFSSTICNYIEPASFYLRELAEKGQLLRPGTDARVLSDIDVKELVDNDCISLNPEMKLGELIQIIAHSQHHYFPVEESHSGQYLGMVRLDEIRPYMFQSEIYDAVLVEQIMDPQAPTVGPNDDIAEILAQMNANHRHYMPVVSNHRFLGLISKATLLDRYRQELMVQTET